MKKPIIKLVGTDGNAFAILGRCLEIARKAKWTPETVKAFKDEATSGDYSNLLSVCCKYFDVR